MFIPQKDNTERNPKNETDKTVILFYKAIFCSNKNWLGHREKFLLAIFMLL